MTKAEQFLKAVTEGLHDLLLKMLKSGVSPDTCDRWNGTALILAIDREMPEIVKLLIKNGANVDLKSESGISPLFKAVSMHDVAVVEILLDAGADIHTRDRHDDTPLIEAAGHPNIDVIKLLLARGADPNDRGFHGRTPLMAACCSENVDLLLKAGADSLAADHSGHSPWVYAARNGRHDCMERLPSTQVSIEVKQQALDQGLLCVSDHRASYIEPYLALGARLEARDALNKTPLIRAASHPHLSNFDIVQLLLKHGADVHARDVDRWTASLYAQAYGRTAIVELLRSKGGDPTEVVKIQNQHHLDDPRPIALVVDDDAEVSQILALMLSKLGYRSLTACSGSDGLLVAAKYRPDIIFLDMMMPIMNGFSFFQQLMQTPWGPQIRVIASTAKSQDSTFDPRMAGILPKPADREALRRALDKAMSRPPPS